MDIKALPKIDLHCHLDGSMTLDTVRQLAGDKSIDEKAVKAKERCADLAEYLEKFDLPLSYMQDRKGLEQTAYRLIEEAAKENVRYIEVRFAPMLSTAEDLSCRQVIESVWKGLQKGREKYRVKTNMIVCAMRHHPPEQNLEMLKTAREMLGWGVCALDLAGDEAAFANNQFRELFHQAAAWEMPFTIHAGECGSVENVREAMALGARRVGHGIALQEDPELMKNFARRGIGIEMCPTSNLQTQAVRRWEDYPLSRYLENGLLVSVNTDNRTVSDTTVTKELEMVFKSCGRREEVIYQLLRNAAATAFAADDIKHDLLKELSLPLDLI